MTTEIKPIRSKRDYEAALSEIGRLWGAKAGTPEGDRAVFLLEQIDLMAFRSQTGGPKIKV